MFEMIHIEDKLQNHPRVVSLLLEFKNVPVNIIEDYQKTWGKFKKPYLHKRDNLHLYLAQKKGTLVKRAPDAYGVKGAPHYYFVHAYNCIYECQYCYLQGYFDNPDIVLFLNHDEIKEEMKTISLTHSDAQEVWFHAGEFSDSLALSHLSGELPIYYDFFSKNPNLKLELRTKSVNIRELKKLSPLKNVVVSFSLSPETVAKQIDLKTPSIKSRIKAMKELVDLGHIVAIHFDPIVYTPQFKEEYRELVLNLKSEVNLAKIEYISIGVVRYTPQVSKEVERNYPTSMLFSQELVTDHNLVRYTKKMREGILNCVSEILIDEGFEPSKLYKCME